MVADWRATWPPVICPYLFAVGRWIWKRRPRSNQRGRPELPRRMTTGTQHARGQWRDRARRGRSTGLREASGIPRRWRRRGGLGGVAQVLLASWSFFNPSPESCRRPVVAVADVGEDLGDGIGREDVRKMRNEKRQRLGVERGAEIDGVHRNRRRTAAAPARWRWRFQAARWRRS